jgi:hypothetical protein
MAAFPKSDYKKLLSLFGDRTYDSKPAKWQVIGYVEIIGKDKSTYILEALLIKILFPRLRNVVTILQNRV